MSKESISFTEISPEKIKVFWSKVHIGSLDECWQWQAGRTGGGYGAFNPVRRTQVVLTHRLAFFLHTGINPVGQVVRHYVCDNPPCCNPRHLRVGTYADNSQDMVRKGRSCAGKSVNPDTVLRGEKAGNSKYTEAIVREMLTLQAQGLSQRAIARQFHMPIVSAQRILNRVTWKHVIFQPSLLPPSA